MSSIHAAQPAASSSLAGFWKEAASRVQKVVQRFVVPVSSTDEMNEVWKLYRLIPSTDKASKISDC